MSYVSPPKGGSDVQDALMSTQRGPDYNSGKSKKNQKLPMSEVDNISDYVAYNLRKVDKGRHEEHR
jgi:hypothetical protein